MKYLVQAQVNRPTFLDIEVDAEYRQDALAMVEALLEKHVGLKHIEWFPELTGMSEGTYYEPEILDCELDEGNFETPVNGFPKEY